MRTAVTPRWRRLTAAMILVFAAVPRLWAALYDHGVYWPDEIYQGLEQAHRFAFGYGFLPWEFKVGARTWLLPGAIGILWKIVSFLGVDDSLVLVAIAKTAVAAISVGGVLAAMSLAERLVLRAGRDETEAFAGSLFAGIVASAFPLAVVMGSRTLAEVVNGPLVVLSALFLLPRAGAAEAGRARSAISGALSGLAFLLRFQSLLLVIPLLAWPIAERRNRDAAAHAGGLAAVLALGAALDTALWGNPAHTFLTYARFHIAASMPGVAPAPELEPLPASYYFLSAWTSTGPVLLAIAAGALLSVRRAPWLAGALALFVAFHCAVFQKEYRYLMTILPLLASLAGVGLAIAGSWAASRANRPLLHIAVAGALVMGWALAWRSASVRFEELGHYVGTPAGPRRPWHFHEEINRLLHEAGTHDDLCGLAMSAGGNMIWNGGYTYLHRDVPVLGLWESPQMHAEPRVLEAANYALIGPGTSLPSGFELVLAGPTAGLFRRPGPCVAHPELDHRELEPP